jgi:acetolactate synthase-1/2/3 large subunit
VEVTRAITKHNYLVMDIEDLPRVMKEVRQAGWLPG